MHDVVELRAFPLRACQPRGLRFSGAVAMDPEVPSRHHLEIVDREGSMRPEILVRALARPEAEPLGFGPALGVLGPLTIGAMDRLVHDDRVCGVLALGSALVVPRERLASINFAHRVAAELDDRALQRRRVRELPLHEMAREATGALSCAGWRAPISPEDLGRALLAGRALKAREGFRRALALIASPVSTQGAAEDALCVYMALLRGHGKTPSVLPAAEPAGISRNPPPPPGAACSCHLSRIE